MSALRALPAEYDLLIVARAVTGALSPTAVRPLLLRGADSNERAALAKGMTSEAMASFQQVLARGCVRSLLRRGGWRRDLRYNEGDGLVRARLWETTPAPLVFTKMSFELARWMTLEPMGHPDVARAPSSAPAGSGDELFLYLACGLLERLDLLRGDTAPLSPMVATSALAQLAFPDAISPSEAGEAQRVAALLDTPAVLGGLQADLVEELILRLERRKARMSSPAAVERLGLLVENRLSVLVDAAAQRGRLDLLGFVVEACSVLVEQDGQLPALDDKATLEARQRARTASAGVLRVAARLHEIYEARRHVGFVDDDYEQAQALLGAWEAHAPALRRARGQARAWSGLPPETQALVDPRIET